MNDIASGTSAPPASTPSSAPAPSALPQEQRTSLPALEVMSPDDDATDAVEQLREDEGRSNENLTDAERSFRQQDRINKGRHGRRRTQLAAKDARIAELEARAAPTPADSPAEPPDAGDDTPATAEQPMAGDDEPAQHETPEEFAERVWHQETEKREQAKREALFQHHERQLAARIFPDYDAVIAAAPRVNVPPEIVDEIESDPVWGPVVKYMYSRPENQGELVALLRAPPQQQRRIIQRALADSEAFFRHSRVGPPQQQQPARRVTQARPPMRPLGNGGAAPSTPNNAHLDGGIDGTRWVEAERRRQGRMR
jgi:hypothetical protein